MPRPAFKSIAHLGRPAFPSTPPHLHLHLHPSRRVPTTPSLAPRFRVHLLPVRFLRYRLAFSAPPTALHNLHNFHNSIEEADPVVRSRKHPSCISHASHASSLAACPHLRSDVKPNELQNRWPSPDSNRASHYGRIRYSSRPASPRISQYPDTSDVAPFPCTLSNLSILRIFRLASTKPLSPPDSMHLLSFPSSQK